MSSTAARNIDRVEEFTAAIDIYDPVRLDGHEDDFRVFARFVSSTIDARYLARHPPQELLPDLEHLMVAGLVRHPEEIRIRIAHDPDAADQRSILAICLDDHPFILSTVLMTLEVLGLRRQRYLGNAVPIRRSVTGEIGAVGLQEDPVEAFLWFELDTKDVDGRQDEITATLQNRLEAARRAVNDFEVIHAMVAAHAERAESLARSRPDQRIAHDGNARFLRWLLDDNFVFLGSRFLPIEDAAPSEPVGDHGVGTYQDHRGIQIEDADHRRAKVDDQEPAASTIDAELEGAAHPAQYRHHDPQVDVDDIHRAAVKAAHVGKRPTDRAMFDDAQARRSAPHLDQPTGSQVEPLEAE